MQAALQMVRDELGPDASVLHTREVRRSMLGRLLGGRLVEVTASTEVTVPSRLPESGPGLYVEPSVSDASLDGESVAANQFSAHGPPAPASEPVSRLPGADVFDYRERFRDDLKGQISDLQSMVADLCRRNEQSTVHELPESLFHLYTDLIDAEVSEDLARELTDRVRATYGSDHLDDPILLKAQIARMIEEEIEVAGPIRVDPGQRRLVALVGPTGVGKTTTIAKLAANFRLREKQRVGLITVDTYRIAAVEQLRTYADIIDLPMEVVSTPKEMREAVARMAHLDLVLMDTAGRSPRDEVRIQELKSMLVEAQADEVHLVLSSVASASSLKKTAEKFLDVGVTGLLLTKLDEATGLGNLLPLLRSCKLPLSYVTNGQNVPDDICAAERGPLARMVLGMQPVR